MRLFLIQHDCGHGSFFRHRAINDWVGRVFGVVTLTPYDYWKRTHAAHHAELRQSRPPRPGRHRNADGRRISGSQLARAAWLSALSPSDRDVRPRADLSLPVAASRAARPDAREGWKPWLSTMSTNLGDRARRRPADVADRPRSVPLDPRTDLHARRDDRRLAVLRPASIRRHALGARGAMEPARGGAARLLLLRPAARPALVQRQHRRASRPSPRQPHSLLSAARSAARPSGARQRSAA